MGVSDPGERRKRPAELASPAMNFEILALETRVSVQTLNTFAAISAPENAHLFTKVAAMKAFAHVHVAPCAKLPKKS